MGCTRTGRAADVAALDSLFECWNRGDAPGLTVGIAFQGETIYRRGFGMASLETAAALTPRSRLRIGSTTKHFTALLALLLSEEAAFNLDEPIRTYLPELTGPTGDPTSRQLLGHRGGGRCSLDLSFIGSGDATPPVGTQLALLCRQEGRNFPPGDAMIYNNGGYHLVSIALERVGGAPFERLLKRRLFAPLSMAATASTPSDHVISEGMATMHVPDGKGGWRRGLFPSEEVRGEGAIVSDVDDMLRWAAHLRTRDRFGSPATWSQLTEPARDLNGVAGRYALGLRVDGYRGVRAWRHAGGVVGGLSEMLVFPDHALDIVILANGAPDANPVLLADKIADIFLANQLGATPPRAKLEGSGALIGDWWSADAGTVYRIGELDGELTLGVNSDPALPLIMGSEGRLLASSVGLGDISIEPAGAASGAVRIRFGGATQVYTKLPPRISEARRMDCQDALIGLWRSHDADCRAEIGLDAAGFRMVTHGRYGISEARLETLGPRTAFARWNMPGLPLTASLTLDDGDRPTGFSLDTTRTRGLRFERVAA